MLKIKHQNTMNHCLFKEKDTEGAVGNTVDYSSFTVVVCSVFWNIDDFVTGVKLFPPLFRVSYPIYLQFPSN